MKASPPHLDQPIGEFVRRDFAELLESMTAREALDAIREKGLGEKIVYFYVVDESERLVGVLPTRRLLTALPDDRIGDLMIRRVIAIPQSVTLLGACEFFVLHKFSLFGWWIACSSSRPGENAPRLSSRSAEGRRGTARARRDIHSAKQRCEMVCEVPRRLHGSA
jgi:hypothetical protein